MNGATCGWLHRLQRTWPGLELRPPATEQLIGSAERDLSRHLPNELTEILRCSNGLAHQSFALCPIYDPSNPKKTWDSLQRANDPTHTEVFGGDLTLHERFLIFADLGNGHALIDQTDGSIWYDEGTSELHQTTFSLKEFVEAAIAGAA